MRVSFLFFLVGGLVLTIWGIVAVGVTRSELGLVGSDFRSHFTAATMVKNGWGRKLYDLEEQFRFQNADFLLRGRESLLPFLNPPITALLVTPIALLSLQKGYLAWGLLTSLSLGGCLVWMLKDREILLAAVFLLAVAVFFPIWEVIYQGQISSVLLLLGLWGGWKSLREGRKFRCGLWLSLFWIRLLVVAPVVWMLWKREWAAMRGFMVGTIITLGLSVLTVGTDGLLSYGRLIWEIPGWGEAYGVHLWREPTLKGLMVRLNVYDWRVGMVGVGMVWAVFGSVWRKIPREKLGWFWIGLMLVTILMSWHTNTHDLTMLLGVEAVMLETIKKRWRYIVGWGWAGGLAGGILMIADPVWLGVGLGALLGVSLMINSFGFGSGRSGWQKLEFLRGNFLSKKS